MDYRSVSKVEDEGITVDTILIYARKIIKKWWVIATAAVLLAAVGFAIATITYVPKYSSQIMFIANNKQTSLIVSGQSSADLSAAVTLAESYKYVFTTTELSTKVANNCGYKIDANDVKSFVSVQSVEDTAIVYLTVTTTDPKVSHAIANTYMLFYEEAITTAFPSTTLTVIDPPLLPTAPNKNSTTLIYTLLGFIIGLAGATLALVFAMILKDSVMSADDIKNKLGLKIIGNVAHVQYKAKKGEKRSILITDRRSGFSFIETFKMIRTKLDNIVLRRGQKAIVITSTMENEGKTTTAVNIALALAKNGKEVLLIDGDLRKPAVAKSLGININEGTGVLDVVNGSRSLAESIRYSEKYNLYLLLNGRGIPDPAELISTPQMEEIITTAKKEFDYIIIDTPPCGEVADAAVLAGFSDSSILVIRQDVAPLRRIRRAIENLENSGTEIIGCVYNDAKSGIHGRHAYGKDGYGYEYGRREK